VTNQSVDDLHCRRWAKVVETQGEEVSEFVAEGRVELGLIVIPNIMSVPGAEAVGPCRPRSTPS
jgi:hypothetical protein